MLFAILFVISLGGAAVLMIASGRLRLSTLLPAPLQRSMHTLGAWWRTSAIRHVLSCSIPWWTLTELGALALWTLWFGRSLLDFNPTTLPLGGEFIMATQSHIVWTWFDQCGTCVLWNGAVNGGNPAFVDLHGAVTHPLVILTTLIWGYGVGIKMALIGCFYIGGLAQWWFARLLGLGRAVRLWSAALAVVGGHLAGRLEVGVFGVVLSTACASLAMVAGIALALDGRRRSAVLFGITLALTIMAGQGYLQLGLIFMFPAFIVFILTPTLRIRPVWREFMFAGMLALLLSAIFLVPLLHFWPQIGKDIDPYFQSAQSLEYAPLNLVVHDVDFYHSTLLHKQPYPYLYMTYIGWIPVLFAFAGLRYAPTRILLFVVLALGLIYTTSSGIPFMLLASVTPLFAAGIRNPSLIAGLAVPLVIGLASLGIHHLSTAPWPKLLVRSVGGMSPGLGVSWLILIVAYWSLLPVMTFGEGWLRVQAPLPSVAAATSYLHASNLRWVQFPYSEGFWLPGAFDAHLKVTNVFRPWRWADRPFPLAAEMITRRAEDITPDKMVAAFDGIIIAHTDVDAYARVEQSGSVVPCVAQGLGGALDITCETYAPGSLVVQENAWSGWTAAMDGKPIALTPDRWLRVAIPAGKHHFTFRYQPWDVLVGAALSLTGLFVALWHWFRVKHPIAVPVDITLPKWY